MSLEVKVPSVGESINEVTIAQWTKKEGEFVEMDDVICELESDKATFELTAEKSGILKILVKEGETISIGTAIGTIEEGEGTSKNLPDGQQTKSTTSSEPKKTGKVIEMKVPVVAESITEVTLSSWLKADGELVALDEGIAEIESDKATFELPAETQGKLQIIAKEGDTLKIGDLICRIEEMEGGVSDAPASAHKQEMTTPIPQNEDNYATGHPSPAAAKIMSERGISNDQIKGTGKDGRITKEDALKTEKNTPEKVQDPRQEQPARLTTGGSRDQNRQKMSSLRKTIARRLVAVKNETAMLTTFNEVDMQPVMDIRKKYKDSFKEKYEVNLGFMSFFTKACCLALTEWPAVNAMIDGDELVYNNFCDISIAVSTPKGLVVPVIRNAENMSFDQIEKEIIRLATKARDGKLSIEEMQGGTFTITNGGVFGSMLSTPIINSPQSAILGMHNIVQRPVAIDGEVKIRPIMYVALSYDHRIVDGRESVSFLVRLKELLEDPTRLLLSI